MGHIMAFATHEIHKAVMDVRRANVAVSLDTIDKAFEGTIKLHANGQELDSVREPWFLSAAFATEMPNSYSQDLIKTLLFTEQLSQMAQSGKGARFRVEDVHVVDATDIGEKNEYKTEANVSTEGDVSVIVTTIPNSLLEKVMQVRRSYHLTRRQHDGKTLYTLSVTQHNLEKDSDDFTVQYGLEESLTETNFFTRISEESTLNNIVKIVDGQTGTPVHNIVRGEEFFRNAEPRIGKEVARRYLRASNFIQPWTYVGALASIASIPFTSGASLVPFAGFVAEAAVNQSFINDTRDEINGRRIQIPTTVEVADTETLLIAEEETKPSRVKLVDIAQAIGLDNIVDPEAQKLEHYLLKILETGVIPTEPTPVVSFQVFEDWQVSLMKIFVSKIENAKAAGTIGDPETRARIFVEGLAEIFQSKIGEVALDFLEKLISGRSKDYAIEIASDTFNYEKDQTRLQQITREIVKLVGDSTDLGDEKRQTILFQILNGMAGQQLFNLDDPQHVAYLASLGFAYNADSDAAGEPPLQPISSPTE